MLYQIQKQHHHMASTKIVLRKKMNKDGTYPLAIRITKDRKTSFIYIGQNVKERDWDSEKQEVKKSHANSSRLNNFLMKKRSEANDKMLELASQQDSVTSKAVKNRINPKVNGESFFAYADSYLNNFKESGKYNRFHPDSSRLKNFRTFLQGKDIAFQDITVGLLTQFKAYMKGKQKASDRSVMNHLIIIRTIFNMAIKANAADHACYPFGKDKIQIKLPESIKIGLSMEEVHRLEELNLDQFNYLNHCRNLWLFSFYFAGMRVSDILRLRWSDIQDERLAYKMGKNAKVGSLKCPDKALAILEQYKSKKKKKDDLIFPELRELPDLNDSFDVQRIISYAVKRIDENLRKVATQAGIEKKMTMHIARHTFGNISGDKIPIQMLQKLYRHSSVTTTIGYQSNFIYKDADDALDSVVGS
jgi:integrase/recombinase XerD